MHYIQRLFFASFVLIYHGGLAQHISTNQRVSLQHLFEIADQNNREIQILLHQEKTADAAIQQQKDNLLPTIDATLMASYNSDGYITDRDLSNGFSVPIPDFGNNFIVEAKQIIYAGGAIKTAIELAKGNKDLAGIQTQEVRQSIRFGITSYYLELLKLKNQRIILVRNIDQTQKLIDQIRAKNKEGVALKNSITRYELQKQSLEVSLLKLDNTVRIVNMQLVDILKLPKGTILQIEDEHPLLNYLNSSVNDLYWENLANEYATPLQRSNIQIEQAERATKLVKSEKLSQVFAFAANYLNGPVMIEIPVLNNNFNYWNVGLGIKYNISSLFKNQSKKAQASINLQIAQLDELNVKEALYKDLKAAQIRFIETQKIYQTHLKGIELANQNYTIIRNRFLNDMALTTEMLDAENTRLDAEMQASNSQINILFQYYQLKKISGTL